ncbi:hypothetical protein [Nostoc sp.]|uniref:hypothetical protein n=1 Tax=Nostoc sp. TaxID=1180 RepID=UPI002FF83A39
MNYSDLPTAEVDRSQFIGNSLNNSIVFLVLHSLLLSGVLIPKTQIFLLRHVPISLVFAYGIGGQDTTLLENLLPRGDARSYRIRHPSGICFYLCFKSIPDVILIPRSH